MPELHPYRRILALVRLDASDDVIVGKALLLARLNRAHLDLLHVVELDGALDGGYPRGSQRATVRALEAAALRRLEFLAASMGASEACCHARYGQRRQVLERLIRQTPPDLVVTGEASACVDGAYDTLVLSAGRRHGGRGLSAWLAGVLRLLTGRGIGVSTGRV